MNINDEYFYQRGPSGAWGKKGLVVVKEDLVRFLPSMVGE